MSTTLTRRRFVGTSMGAVVGAAAASWLWTPLAAHAETVRRAATPPGRVALAAPLSAPLSAAAGGLSIVLAFPDQSVLGSISVTGATTSTAHPGGIDVVSAQLGMRNQVTLGSATTGAGKLAYSALRIEKTVDSASAALFEALTRGDHFPRALLFVRQAGAPDDYVFYELGTVFVTSIDVQSATSDSLASETVDFVFGAMEVDYTFAGTTLAAGWDQVANTPVNLPDVAPPPPPPAPAAPSTIWMIGSSGNGNHSILHYDQPSADWVTTDGLATRIAVGQGGQPWVVNAAGSVFRRLAGPTSLVDGSWQSISGVAASDIGVGADGSVWVLDTTPASGGHGIWLLTGTSGSGASVVGTWRQVDGAALAISVGPDGQPWVVNAAGSIFSRMRGGASNSYADGTWTSLAGAASDIGVGSDGSVFVIGTNATIGGFGVLKLVSGAWQTVAGSNGGVRIAVDSRAEPVVVDKSGVVWCYQASTNLWQSLNASSTGVDVGVANA